MIPRPEYPRPQLVRNDWMNLNGEWTCELDPARTGAEKNYAQSRGFSTAITVPFCPESKMSGLAHTDFIDEIWYHRTISIPAAWNSSRVILHFGGIDYESEVFIDGAFAGRHFGGNASFAFDITRFVKTGSTHDLVVRARDNVRAWEQPAGKQCSQLHSSGCHYTRTTGIWQTVWLEPVNECGISSLYIVADLDNGRFSITPQFYSTQSGSILRIKAFADGSIVREISAAAVAGVPMILPLANPRPWSPADPFLYDLTLEIIDRSGAVLDSVSSYAGLRKVHTENGRVMLNNKPVYQRLVLDQGFYPNSIWTAPTDNALKRDIELAMAAGFNGARLHQKVFEERFHYWADTLGYLTWGESPSWGFDMAGDTGARNFLAEWREIVIRDRSHPSIIAWSPFNESEGNCKREPHNRLIIDAYHLTRDLDPTRPVNDSSGWYHQKTDLWTVHTYEQDPAKLAETLAKRPDGSVFINFPEKETVYEGQPYIVDEYGGIKWIPPGERAFANNSWGYGDAPAAEEDFYQRLDGLTKALLNTPHVCGYCYTQLTDVEQEQNGIYNYDRTEKFDMTRVRKVFSKEPA